MISKETSRSHFQMHNVTTTLLSTTLSSRTIRQDYGTAERYLHIIGVSQALSCINGDDMQRL